MKNTLKICSILLQYPSEELVAGVQELEGALREERAFSDAERLALHPLLSRLANDDLFDSQETYVLLFDRSRTLSLNLFEHVHGESRDRGSAMVNLLETYRANGLDFESSELPDYLPAFLEYLTTLPEADVVGYLAEIAPILWALHERLTRRSSDYAEVFLALARLAGGKPAEAAIEELKQEPADDPNDLAALDAVWQEAEITFGPSADAGCPAVRNVLANMAVPKTQPLDMAVQSVQKN